MTENTNTRISLFEKGEQGDLLKTKKHIEVQKECILESQLGFYSYKNSEIYLYVIEENGKLKTFKEKFYCGICKKIKSGSGGNVAKHFDIHSKVKTTPMLSDKDINSRLIIWMINHQIPFAAFQDETFCEIFPNKLSYRGIKETIHDTALKIFQVIKNEIQNSSYVSIGSDGWQSEGGRRFIGLNAYYIQNNEIATTRFFKLTNLEFKDHTGINIANCIKDNQFQIGYHKKVIAYSCDSANVNKTVAKNLHVDFDPCFVHLLNLSFNASFGSDKRLLEIGQLTNQLHSTAKFVEFLATRRIELSIAQVNITSFSLTRWLTLIDSLASVSKMKNVILDYFAFLKSNNLFNEDDQMQEIHENDIEDIEKIMPLLLKIKEFYKEMLVFPKINFLSDLSLILDEILSIVQNAKLNPKYFCFADSIAKLEIEMKENFFSIKKSACMFLMSANYLDPSGAKIKVFDDTKIVDEVQKFITNNLPIVKDSNEEEINIEKLQSFSLADRKRLSAQTKNVESIKNELKVWKSIHEKQSDKENIINYWERMSDRFPRLSLFAIRLCFHRGTNVNMENSFSLITRILRSDRFSLSLKTINDLAILTMNRDLCNDILLGKLKVTLDDEVYPENAEDFECCPPDFEIAQLVYSKKRTPQSQEVSTTIPIIVPALKENSKQSSSQVPLSDSAKRSNEQKKLKTKESVQHEKRDNSPKIVGKKKTKTNDSHDLDNSESSSHVVKKTTKKLVREHYSISKK